MTTELLEIVKELRAALVAPPERRLWSLVDIAGYSGYSLSTVQQKVACLPDFPDAVEFRDGAQPRWVAGEVMEWFEAKRRRQSKRRARSSAEGLK